MNEISVIEGMNIKDKKAIRYYDNVSLMKNDTTLKEGMYVKTKGYYSINDNGKSEYHITNTKSLTEYQEELNNGLYATLIIGKEINPIQMGAYGDNQHDDSTYLKNTIKYAISMGLIVRITKPHYVEQSLLTNEDYDNFVEINIKGCVSPEIKKYAVTNESGIRLKNGISLFDSIDIGGEISNLLFANTTRENIGSIFNNCNVKGLLFEGNTVSNIGAFLLDSNVSNVTYINNNKFFTVYYFAKLGDRRNYIGLTDSIISNNYINGGAELNNNHCFEFLTYNASMIQKNFIDYYQTIYFFNSNIAISSDTPTSIGNQYQVFRYFYDKHDNVSNCNMSSNGDTFNWNKESDLEKLQLYEKKYYTGNADSQQHEMPSYICMIDNNSMTNIVNANLEGHLENIIFIRKSLSSYDYAKAKFTFNKGYYPKTSSYPVTHSDKFFNGTSYANNLIDIPFYKSVESLPEVGAWSDYYLGEKVIYNNSLYRLIYNYENSKYEWIKIYE